MRRTAMQLLVTAGLVATTAVGCGDAEEPAEPRLAYVEANRICLEVAERFDELQVDSPRSFEQGEKLLTVLLDAARTGERAFAQVEAPPLQAVAFERYLKSRRRVSELLEQGLEAAREEKGETYERVRLAANEAADERRRLAEYSGLSDCVAAERG